MHNLYLAFAASGAAAEKPELEVADLESLAVLAVRVKNHHLRKLSFADKRIEARKRKTIAIYIRQLMATGEIVIMMPGIVLRHLMTSITFPAGVRASISQN